MDNNPLRDIPVNSFRDQQHTLEFLSFASCSLKTLHQEYFDLAFDEEVLKIVNGMNNSWDCDGMCDFIRWMNENDEFKAISRFGFCNSPNYLEGKPVSMVTNDEGCIRSGAQIFATFMLLTAFTTFSILICWCCAMNTCCCCCDTNSSFSRDRYVIFRL